MCVALLNWEGTSAGGADDLMVLELEHIGAAVPHVSLGPTSQRRDEKDNNVLLLLLNNHHLCT